MHLRETNAHFFVHRYRKLFGNKRRLAQTVNMVLDLLLGNGFRTRLFHHVAKHFHAQRHALIVRTTHGLDRKVGGIPQRKRAVDLHRYARLQRIRRKRRRRVAHAEHTVTFLDVLHRFVAFLERQANAAVFKRRDICQRKQGTSALIPNLQHVTHAQLLFYLHKRGVLHHAAHAAQENAAIVGALVAHDFVATLVREIRSGKAAAERFRQHAALGFCCAPGIVLLPRFARRQQAVKHGTVHGHHGVHVFGRLHTAFNFQRRHLGIQQLVQQIDAAQILRGKQMLARRGERFAHRLVLELVRQTARLSARSAVCRAPADHGRHVALTGIAHAQRTMAEDFGLHA